MARVRSLVRRGQRNTVIASTYLPPTANPPEGNIPSTVWNRLDLVEPQQGAAIQIDGGGPAEEDGLETKIPVGMSVGTGDLNPMYLDPDHVVNRDMFLSLVNTANGVYNYLIEMRVVELSDDEAIITIIKETSQS